MEIGGVQLFPRQGSTYAGNVDLLFLYLNLLTLFFVVLVATLITVFAIRYRRRREDEVGEQIVGSTKLELSWMVALVPLAMIAFFWGAQLYLRISTTPEDATEIFVIGKQWMWKFVHENGQEEINTLHVPVGQPIKLIMTSQDVIHSFYVPAFRTKADVLPGRYSETWFEATRTGTYHLFCAEYCGTNHALMIGSIIVQDPAQYQQWLSGGGAEAAGGTQGSPAAQGEALFNQLGCAGCHRPEGGGPGPSLVGIFGEPVELESGETVTADESYIRRSIIDPNAQIVAGFQPIMPTYEGQVSEEQILQLIAYIESLSAPAEDAASGSQ